MSQSYILQDVRWSTYVLAWVRSYAEALCQSVVQTVFAAAPPSKGRAASEEERNAPSTIPCYTAFATTDRASGGRRAARPGGHAASPDTVFSIAAELFAHLA
ncbi:hypothetical protein SPI_01782 [Niveomyces insectorum RCEF 264]|uniref:Uncharacterized protein n=1 Tax=Niveomyces insectorum RCEF 264 TaxID=1081102 RepID=A0A167Z8E0_9HYPO|nr:hypothetical protein SPI_01782 [Niveomyces insectorum RCEF 264]